MPSRRLSARTRLDIQLSGLIGAHLLTRTPEQVITALREAVLGDEDVLAEVATSCASWYRNAESAVMCDALEKLASELSDVSAERWE